MPIRQAALMQMNTIERILFCSQYVEPGRESALDETFATAASVLEGVLSPRSVAFTVIPKYPAAFGTKERELALHDSA